VLGKTRPLLCIRYGGKLAALNQVPFAPNLDFVGEQLGGDVLVFDPADWSLMQK
jgi:hypothetical protein